MGSFTLETTAVTAGWDRQGRYLVVAPAEAGLVARFIFHDTVSGITFTAERDTLPLEVTVDALVVAP